MHTIFAFKKSKDFFYFTEKCKFLNWTFLFMNILEELKKLREEYLSADEETKRFLEKRYGKRAINQALEETFSAEWLEKNAKMCPYCGTQIQASFWVNVNQWFFFLSFTLYVMFAKANLRKFESRNNDDVDFYNTCPYDQTKLQVPYQNNTYA